MVFNSLFWGTQRPTAKISPSRQISRMVKRRELSFLSNLLNIDYSSREARDEDYSSFCPHPSTSFSSSSTAFLSYLEYMQTGINNEVDSKETDNNSAQSGDCQPCQPFFPPAEGNTQMNGDAVGKPRNERPCFDWIPCPVIPPQIFGPNTAGRDHDSIGYETENNITENQFVQTAQGWKSLVCRVRLCTRLTLLFQQKDHPRRHSQGIGAKGKPGKIDMDIQPDGFKARSHGSQCGVLHIAVAEHY